MTNALPAEVIAPANATPVAWPSQGEGAYLVPVFGEAASSPAQNQVPIGSVTKLMTAEVVLKDFPLTPGEQGPTYTVTALDVFFTQLDLANGEAVSSVTAGEVLTEYQLLEGTLIHSSCNLADMLAKLDAGSLAPFVAKMNSQATVLAMNATHYADASGVSPLSTSTPASQLILAELLMKNPVFSQIVSQTTVTLPVSGTQTTYQPLLGTQGVVGIKSGLTSQAGGCDVMAVNEIVDGQTIQVLSAVTGQKGTNDLAAAGKAAFDLATSVTKGIDIVTVASAAPPVGTLGWPQSSVNLFVAPALSLPAWPGQHISVTVSDRRNVTGSLPKNTKVATVTARTPQFHVSGNVVTQKKLTVPTLLQRVV
jgi:D-alanyl-D-alanine carboxypeptidase (penicillin-binding protein 5/6)